jgi:transposase
LSRCAGGLADDAKAGAFDRVRGEPHVDDVEEVEKFSAELLYPPPYSPDLNPIEKAWSKLKLLLRSAKARTSEALDEAISELLPQLTQQNAEAWFRTRFGTL